MKPAFSIIKRLWMYLLVYFESTIIEIFLNYLLKQGRVSNFSSFAAKSYPNPKVICLRSFY